MSKNVDLIIRAKDEAAKTLVAITNAAMELTGEAKNLTGATGGTSSALARLKTEASALGTQINNLSGVSKVVTNFDKMTASVNRMDAALSKNAAELEHRKKDLDQAAFAEARNASATAATTKILEAQTAAMKAARTEAAAETAEVDKLSRALDRMNKAKPAGPVSKASLTKAEGVFQENHSALTNTKTEISGLQSALAKAKASSGEMLTDIEQRALAAIRKLSNAATGTGANFSKIRAELSDLSRAEQDAAFKGLLGKNQLIPSQNSSPKTLSKADRAATFSPAGEPFHYASVNPNAPTVSTQGMSEAERSQMEAKLAKLEALRERQTEALANSQKRVEAAEKRVADAEKKLTDKAAERDRAKLDLQTKLDAAKPRQEAAQARLTSLTAQRNQTAADLADYSAKGKALSKMNGDLGRTVETLTASVERETPTVARAKVELADLATVTQKATAAAGLQAAAIETVTAAQTRQTNAMAAAKGRIEALSGGGAVKAQAPVTDTASGFLKARADRKTEMEAAAAEATRLGKALAAADGPAEELAAAFGRAAEKSRVATQAYLDQYSALTKLSGKSSFAAFSQRADASVAAARPKPVAPPAAPIGNLGIKEAGDAGEAGARGIKSFGDALKGIYGDSRESLSLMQRLRGEVLALTASYVGFQAVLTGISKSVDAFKNLEAVENRLGAVFNQDQSRVGNEVSYLKREADRLGISFSVLADQYGKFNIAANAANFTSQETRKVFMSVAEAARVNKLSNDQVNGVFLALTQMLSKGKIQAQELRQQLGDRLPGALQILQSALGLTASEMEDMMQKGELLANSSQLVKFADEMDKRFGPQLAAALRSTTTEIGRFQNNLEQVALTAANGGLIDGFTELLRKLNEYFKSTEGVAFFQGLGAAAGRLMSGLAALVPYAWQLKLALEGLILLKLVPLFAGIITSVNAYSVSAFRAVTATGELSIAQKMASASAFQLSTQTRLAQVGLEMLGVAAGVSSARIAGASAALGMFRTGLAAAATGVSRLFALLGGWPTLIAGAVLVATGNWFTSVEDVTEELTKHAKVMSDIVGAYDKAADKSGDWAKNVEGATRAELMASRARILEQQASIRSKIVAPGSEFSDGIQSGILPLNAKLTDIVEKFNAGKMSAKDFILEVDKIAQADPKVTPQIVEPMIKAAREIDKTNTALDQNSAALKVVEKTSTDADRAIIGTNDSLKNNGFKPATVDVLKFNEAIDKLKGSIPALASEMKMLKDLGEAFKAANDAVNAAGIKEGEEGSPAQIAAIQKATDLLEKANKAIFDQNMKDLIKLYGGDKVPLSLAKVIKGGEGFPLDANGNANAYKDIGGKPTIGLGNTTYQDGSPVKMGDVITKAEAVKLMVDTLNGFAGMVDAAVAGAKLSENQRNALISYVYNVGNTNGSPETRAIFDSIRRNDPAEKTAGFIAAGVNTVKGVPTDALKNRRASEAKLFLTPDDRAAGQDSGATGYDVSKQKTETQLKGDKAIDDKVAQNLREAAAQKKINDADNQTAAKKEVEIEKAIADERRKAAEEGREFSKEREAQLRSSTAALYDQMHVNDQAKEAEEKVNSLYKLRQQILEQIKVSSEQGNATELAAAETALKKVNEETRQAIELAIKYWQAIGGTEADTAIAKLKIMGLTTEKNKVAILTAKQANEMLANGAVRAFTTVADSVGKAIAGTGKWKDVLGATAKAFLNFAADFMREIAQMILKQLILNALSSAMGMPGGVGGGVAGFVNGLVGKAHTGGVVGSRMTGSGNGLVSVNPAWFDDAARFHKGGIAGLAPDEVPTILKKNEEVLTENDPRHVMNGGKDAKGGAGGMTTLQQALLLDPKDIEGVLSTPSGQKLMITAIRMNKSTVKQILG